MNLVTGGTGLVGAHLLLHLLQKGEKAKAIYRSEKNIQKTKRLFKELGHQNLFPEIEWVLGDVTDIPSLENAFKDVSYVYHCAAFISFDSKDEDLLRKINIEGTANMLHCALHFGVTKFCHVSSIAALGDPIGNNLEVDETNEWNPEKYHSDYGLTKYGAEMEVFRAQQEGLNCVIVNPGVILGLGFWNSGSGKIFKSVSKGIPFYTNGSSGFIAVEDVVEQMYSLMKSDSSNERYILVAENIPYISLLNWIAEGMNTKKSSVKIGAIVTKLLAKLNGFFSFFGLKKIGITKDLALSLHNSTLYSNKKIKALSTPEFKSIETYSKFIASRYALYQDF